MRPLALLWQGKKIRYAAPIPSWISSNLVYGEFSELVLMSSLSLHAWNGGMAFRSCMCLSLGSVHACIPRGAILFRVIR